MFVGEDQPKSRARSALLAGSSYLELGYGRFMQTDPLGYDDGLNWYNYAHGDAVNGTDPSGTSCTGSLFDFCPGTLSGSSSSTNPASSQHDSDVGDLLMGGANYATANKAANIWQSTGGNLSASLAAAAAGHPS